MAGWRWPAPTRRMARWRPGCGLPGLAYGQGAGSRGPGRPAIAELSASLADRREWLADKPDNAERQRALMVGLQRAGRCAVGHRAEGRGLCAYVGEAGGMMQP